nr:serine/threonine-protein kinase [Kofleriaceae bacterium]
MPWFCATCGELADSPGGCPRDGSPLEASAGLDLVGHAVGDYTCTARLGGGGYATVYTAVHRRSLAAFALKLFRAPVTAADAGRVVVEARAASAIQHHNVVRVFDAQLDAQGRPFLVMELLDGPTLRDVIGRPFFELLPLFLDVLAGVDAAHRVGIVHRDLKPENVVVTPARGAVVLDFGVAKIIEDPLSPSLTVTGERLGTPRYMSPEQITGGAVSPRTDVYALGVMLYEAIAGAPPFPSDAVFALFQAHLSAEPPPLAARGIAPRLAAVVERALAKDPARRFADAGELRRALADAAGVASTAGSAPPRAPRKLAGVAVAFAVIAVVAGVGVAARLGEPAAARTTDPKLGSAGDPDPGFVLPPATVALDPNLERTLAMLAPTLSQIPRVSRIQTLCAVHQAAHNPALAPEYRSYYQRYELLVHESLPGEDPARLCGR